MAKFTIEQMEKADKERQCREKKLNEGLNLKQFSPRDRQAPVLDVVVYRLEFPKLYNSKETLKLFHRVAGMISYHRRKSEKGKDMIAVIRIACNAAEKEQAKAEKREAIEITHFSVHHLRHTFCTRFCENETNIKVIQEIMGHSDISTTMNIYAEATEAKKKDTINCLDNNYRILPMKTA